MRNALYAVYRLPSLLFPVHHLPIASSLYAVYRIPSPEFQA